MLLFLQDTVGNGFNPSMLSGNVAWYDFTNSSYLTLVSTAITQALDRSGSGNNTSVQGTSTARPTFTASQLNGLPTAVFDGGDTLLLPSGVFGVPNGDNTVFVVSKRNTETGAANFLVAMNVAGASRWTMNYSSTAGRVQFLSRNLTTNPAMNNDNTNTNYSLLTGFRSGTTLSCTVNGNIPATTSNGVSEPAIDAGFIGSFEGATLFLTGGIAEIIIYNRALTSTEIAQVERYLVNKYNTYYPNANWISAYSAWQQVFINAWGINRDNSFTNTTGNPIAAMWDPSLAALGSTTSLPDTGRRVSTATEGSSPPVNTANGIGTANALLYNGTNSMLSAGSASAIDNLFAAGGCYIGVIKASSDGEGDVGRLFQKSRLLRVGSEVAGFMKMTYTQPTSGTSGIWYLTNADIAVGAGTIIAMTYNSANLTTDPVFYVNSLTPKAVTESSTPTGTATDDSALSMILGNSSGGTVTFDGYQGKVILFKSVPTTAQFTAVFNFLATEYGITLT